MIKQADADASPSEAAGEKEAYKSAGLLLMHGRIRKDVYKRQGMCHLPSVFYHLAVFHLQPHGLCYNKDVEMKR